MHPGLPMTSYFRTASATSRIYLQKGSRALSYCNRTKCDPEPFRIHNFELMAKILRRVHWGQETAQSAIIMPEKQVSFPFYISSNPEQLNRALISLFKEYRTNIESKICYNLLISNATPNLKTYNILIRGFSLLRRPSFSIYFFRALIEAGFIPDRYTFIALATLFSSSGNRVGFTRLMSTIQRHRHRRRLIDDPYLNTCLIVGLFKCHKIKRANYFIRQLKKQGHNPSIHILTLQLKFCVQYRKWSQGKPLVEAILEHPDIDHWAIFWAWKLSVKGHYLNMQQKLRNFIQSHGINEETLWKHPSKKRGLKVRRQNKEPRASDIARERKQLLAPDSLLQALKETHSQFTSSMTSNLKHNIDRPSLAKPPTPPFLEPALKPSPWKMEVWKAILSRRHPTLN